MAADTTPSTANADALARFAADHAEAELPEAVKEAARFCIVDWFGVAIGAANEQPVQAIRRAVAEWGAQGRAHILLDGTSNPAAAALVNGTMAHLLDFDDTHVGSIAHLSGPTFAAAYAVGSHLGASPRAMTNAFVIGFETGARLGSAGAGLALNERSIHSTGVFGCLAASAAAAAMYRLPAEQFRHAMALGATQVSGLVASFGTPAKPFHAGKAGFNGVLAAQLARQGYAGKVDLLEPQGGLVSALVQDRSAQLADLGRAEGWEITRNTLKPYASCLLTHPVIDAARELGPQLAGRAVEAVRIHVNPLAIHLAGKPNPTTALEGKFSLAFCTALALRGHKVAKADFEAATLADPDLRMLVQAAELVPTDSLDSRAADLEIALADGTTLRTHVPLALGNPGRPMNWDDMRAKFMGLVEPVLGSGAAPLFDKLRRFDELPDWQPVSAGLAAAA